MKIRCPTFLSNSILKKAFTDTHLICTGSVCFIIIIIIIVLIEWLWMFSFSHFLQVNLPHNRLVILLCFSLLSVFGSNVAKFSGAGALGVLTMSTVAAHGWTHKGKVSSIIISTLFYHFWRMGQHETFCYDCIMKQRKSL